MPNDYRARMADELRRLHDGLADGIPMGPLTAGAAKREIGISVGKRGLAGYGKRAFRANGGIADPIWARALVVNNGRRRVALVTADLLLINRILAGAVLDHLRRHEPSWRREDLYFGATHTHSAPGGFAGTFAESVALGPFDPVWTDELADSIADTVRAAASRMVPAELASGAVEIDAELARNRTVAEGPVNRWLDWLQVRRVDGEALATLVVFGAHATCRPTSDGRVSGDYPGVLQREIEGAFGGESLFFAGGVGSMGPPDALCPRERLADELGTRLAARAIAAIRADAPYARTVALDRAGILAPLPTPHVKLGKNLVLSPVLAGLLLENDAWIGAARLGDMVLIGAPADYSGVLAEQLRAAVPGIRTVVTSFSGDYVGYLLPADYYELPKYEPRTMCFYGPDAGETFQRWFTRMAAELGRPGASASRSPAAGYGTHSRR